MREKHPSKKIFSNEIIFETKHFIVNQDWEIAIPGFFIVAPKKKLKSLMDFNDKELIDFIKTVKKVRESLLKVLKIKDVYLFQNEDTPYGFHLWMLPYYSWMKKISERGPSLPAKVWKYAKKNMKTEKDIKKTKKAVDKVKKFLAKK